MNKEEAKEALDYYISLNKPDYAVEITGGWGTGKTFFIKEYIDSLRENAAKDPIYISLYGVKDESEIEKRLWIQIAHSFLRKKENIFFICLIVYYIICALLILVHYFTLITVFSYSIRILEATSLTFIAIALWVYDTMKITILHIFFRWVDLIVFDDFERADMSHKQLLAYINHYVEHLNQHVVIVCNEKEIDKKDDNPSSSFLKIQEKVIGKKIPLGQNNNLVLETMFYQKDFKILRRITNIGNGAKEFFFYHSKPQKGSVNYRVWIICCREFESTFKNIPPEYFDDPSIFKKLLPHFFSLEYALHINDFGKNGSFSKKEADELISPHDFGGPSKWFDQLFGLQSETRDILPNSTWKSIINEEAINENEVLEHWNLLLEKNQPLWLQFYNYLEKTDEEISVLWKRLKKNYLLKNIQNPAQIISIVSSVLDMITNKCCPDSRVTADFVVKFAEHYVKKIHFDKTLDFSRDNANFFSVCETYGHHQTESAEFKRFKTLFKNNTDIFINNHVIPDNFNSLLKVLDQDDEEFDSFWYEQGMRLKPIFDGQDSKLLLDKLTSLSPKRMRDRLNVIHDHLSSVIDRDNKEIYFFKKQLLQDMRSLLSNKECTLDHSKRYWIEREISALDKDLNSYPFDSPLYRL